MTNTLMRHSRVSDEWLKRTMAENRIQPILGEGGTPTGNYLTGPVRLSWTEHLFTPRPPKANGKPTYDCSILFPPGTDFTLLVQAANTMLEANFADKKYIDPADNMVKWSGLEPIFHAQAAKLNYDGYTAGGVYLNISTQFKPQIVKPSPVGKGVMNPITDEKEIYPGVWAICAINPYVYGKNPPQPKKGVKFGIQGICKIQDDQALGGAGMDPRQAFGGISGITADTNVSGMFGAQMGGQPIAGMGVPQHAMMPAGGAAPADEDLGV